MVSTTPHIRRYPGHLLREFVLESGPIIRPRQKGISGPVPGTEMPVAGTCQLRTTTPMKGEISMLLTQIRRFIGIIGLVALTWWVRTWLGYNPSAFEGTFRGFSLNLGDNWATLVVAMLAIIMIVYGWLDRRRWTTLLGYAGLGLAIASGVFVLDRPVIETGLIFRTVGVILLAFVLFGMAFVPSNPERAHIEVHGWLPQVSNFRVPGFARSIGSGIARGGRTTGRWIGQRWQNHRTNAARRAENRELENRERAIRLEELRQQTQGQNPVPSEHATSSTVVDLSDIPAASTAGSPNA